MADGTSLRKLNEIDEKLKIMVNRWTRDLIENVVPFWQKYSIDCENGGFFTHLDVKGEKLSVGCS